MVPGLLAASLLMSGCTSSTNSTTGEPGSTQSASGTLAPSATAPSATAPSTSAPSTSAASGRYSGDGITVTGAQGEEPTITLAEDFGPAEELVVADIVEGAGEPVTADSVLTVHYVGTGQQSREVFDSSWSGAPATFDLAGVIQGWQEGMLGMRPGGRRLLVIPGSLAYGPAGTGGVIGPDETLVFVVDLLQVTQP